MAQSQGTIWVQPEAKKVGNPCPLTPQLSFLLSCSSSLERRENTPHCVAWWSTEPWLSAAACLAAHRREQCNLFRNGSGTPRLNYRAGIQSGRMCSCFLTDWGIKRAIGYMLSFHMTASPSSPLPNQEMSRACT